MQPVRLSRVRVSDNPLDQIHTTLKLMGRAIKDGSESLPIRNYAAALATKAGPKDYLGQVKSIYDRFVTKDWRYVRDPVGKELIHTSPNAIYHMIIGGGPKGVGLGGGKGAGDCDDATIALGSMLRSIGLPIRIGVTAPPGFPAGPSFTHVFAQTSIPGLGWMTVDPVPWPRRGLGYTPDHSRIAFFDLDGRLLGYEGNVEGLDLLGDTEEPNTKNKEVIEMNNYGIPDLTQVPDVGLAGTDDQIMPLDWRKYVLKDFGIYSHQLGILSGEGLSLAAEVETWTDPNGREITRTPMIEIAPNDFAYVNRYGRAYHGMLGLGDEGQVYEYDGFSGFFKKLFKKAKHLVKKVGKKIGKAVKKVVKKIPGGKYLVKIGEKIHKVAMKFTKPLVKFVGKYASKLAPVAALIPGFGPAVAAGMYTAGKVAKLMQKHGVELIGAKGKPRNLKFKSGAAAKAFKAELAKEAEKEKWARERGKASRVAVRRQAVRARRAAPALLPRGMRRTASAMVAR